MTGQDKEAAERSAHVARSGPRAQVPEVQHDRHLWPWMTAQVCDTITGQVVRQWEFQVDPAQAGSLTAQIAEGKMKWPPSKSV